MNPRVKIQHYVPRFYLKSFVTKPKKQSVYCYDKTKGKCFPVSTKNIASESYFYDASQEDGQRIEEALNSVESLFVPVYRKMLASEDLAGLTSDEREAVALFVVVQEHRTREKRETIADMMKQLQQRLYKETLSEEFKERYDIDRWGAEDQVKALHLSTFKNVPLYSEIVLHMKWILFVNHTPMPLWASDHPINRFNPLDAKPYGNLGLICKGIEMHFPLSPRLVLSFCDPTLYDVLPDRHEMRNVQEVTFENWLQVAKSTRYVFSKTDDFALADRILRDDPSLGEISRKRIQMD